MGCQCYIDFGGLSLFVGCEWTLLESNCPSISFSLAEDSANFDDSFGSLVSTGDSSEGIETTSIPITTTQVETTSKQATTLGPLEATLEELQQQLESVKEQFGYPIQVIEGNKFVEVCH